jgi:O-antigen/teichoic acid export membrane protein
MPNDSAQFGTVQSVSEAKKPESGNGAADFFIALAVLCFIAGGLCVFAAISAFSDSQAYVSPAIDSIAAGLFLAAVSCVLRALNRLYRALSEVAKALQWMLDNWPKAP